MGTLLFMLLWSLVCGGYATSRLPHMKSRVSKGLMWASIVSNGVAVVIIAAVIAKALV